ncbi:GNAT family N-acetyltransferase [Pseudomonas sp. Eth.TT006]
MHIDYLCDHPHLIEELAALHFEEWGRFRPGQTVEDRIKHMRKSCSKGAIPSVVVALEGSRLLGGAMLLENDLKLRPDLTPWLAGVYVKTQERGRGIASQLVNRVAEEAAALGVRELYLYTDASQALYARQGWQVVEDLLYDDLPVTVMKFVIQR